MPNNSYYYGFEKETTPGIAARPVIYPVVIKERPRRPGRWQGMARMFHRKAQLCYEALTARKAVPCYTFGNAYLLSDDQIAHSERNGNR